MGGNIAHEMNLAAVPDRSLKTALSTNSFNRLRIENFIQYGFYQFGQPICFDRRFDKSLPGPLSS